MSIAFFRELHDRHYVEGDTPETTTNKIVDDLGLNGRQREALAVLVHSQCQLIARSKVRSIEQLVKAAGIRKGRPVDPAADRRRLLRSSFSLGDGSRVSWGEATADQHRQRAALLSKLRSGIDATVALHVAAIDEIEANGVRCLNDLHRVGVPA